MSDHRSPSRAAPAAAVPAMDRRIARSRLHRLRRWLLPAALVLVAASGVAAFRLVPSAGTLSVAANEVTTAVATEAPFQDTLPVRATVAPLRTVFVAAIEGGTVATVPVQDGAAVRAGDVLATLSNPQLRLDVTAKEAAIAGQLGGISGQRLALQQTLTAEDNAIAETSYDRLKAERELGIRQRLHELGFESEAGVKGYRDEASYYAARLATLAGARERDRAVAARQQAAIDQAAVTLQDNLDEVKGDLQALVLRAPVPGRLTNFALQPGMSLKQADGIGEIDSIGAFRLDTDADEFYLGRVAEGEAASADIDGGTAALAVSRVRPQVVNGQFRIELTFDRAPPLGLRRGEGVDCRITLGRTQTALVLPDGPWLDGSGGSSVFVLEPDGRQAVRRAITTGRRNPEQVEIRSGLSAGDRVIVSSYARYARFSRLLLD